MEKIWEEGKIWEEEGMEKILEGEDMGRVVKIWYGENARRRRYVKSR